VSETQTDNRPIRHAVEYHIRGFHPVPVWDFNRETPDDQRGAGKGPPLTGHTGYRGKYADREQIRGWAAEPRYSNFLLRMGPGQFALDVDERDGGLDTLSRLERKLGRLPATWRVSARDVGDGHLYFQVPSNRTWKLPKGYTAGIQLVTWHLRYAIAAPSINPKTGTVYRWFGRNGRPTAHPLGPRADDLPALPERWVKALSADYDPANAPAHLDLNKGQVSAQFAQWAPADGKPPCRHMLKVIENVVVAMKGGRYDGFRNATLAVLRFGEAGHPGSREACAKLRALYEHATRDDPTRKAAAEFIRWTKDAACKISADPTPFDRRGCAVVFKLPTAVDLGLKVVTLDLGRPAK
jgi:hypothetical protein